MRQPGRVVVGVKDDQPGLGQVEPTTGQYSGFDIEIARLVAAKLGFATDKIDYKVGSRSVYPPPRAGRSLGDLAWVSLRTDHEVLLLVMDGCVESTVGKVTPQVPPLPAADPCS